MSEKDIKTKPKTTTKAVQNAPKAADRFAKEAVKDIKTVSKDVLIKNIIDKQLETRQSEQPQRAEVNTAKLQNFRKFSRILKYLLQRNTTSLIKYLHLMIPRNL